MDVGTLMCHELKINIIELEYSIVYFCFYPHNGAFLSPGDNRPQIRVSGLTNKTGLKKH